MTRLLWSLVLVLALPVAWSAVSLVALPGPRPFLAPAGRGPCVEDPAWMRLHHMDSLKSSRDRFVRQGDRSGATLETCAGCHVDRQAFCDRCHTAANVRLDCFDCHTWAPPASGEEGVP